MWDLSVTPELERRGIEAMRAALAVMIARRLPPEKRLRRVVTWCADGGGLFRPHAATRRYAVAYEVEFAV